VSSVEDRLRQLEDVETIRTLDAVCCRLRDDGDWPAVARLLTPGGVFDELRRVEGHVDLLAFFPELATAGITCFPHVAAGRCADDLVRTQAGRRYRVEQVRSSYGAPLIDGRDGGRYELAGAVPRRRGRERPAVRGTGRPG
jgi:hypothetical protein